MTHYLGETIIQVYKRRGCIGRNIAHIFCLLESRWKDEKFEHELTASVVHSLRNVGLCAFVEAAMQDDVVSNWPSPVVKVQELQYLELLSVNRLLCKCASILNCRRDM